jgi:hypothetical protein
MSAPQANSKPEMSRATYPWRTARRNSAAALIPIGIGGLSYLRKYDAFNRGTAWWVWFVVAAGIISACFGNALLGQIIGPRRSDIIFKIVLAIALVAGIYWLSQALDARMSRIH